MTRSLLAACGLTLCSSTAFAVELPPGGMEIRPGSGIEASATEGTAVVESLPGGTGKRITIAEALPAKAYGAQFTAPFAAAIAKNEPVLAIIKARVIGGDPHGEVLAKLQLRSAPYTSYGATISLGVHSEWLELPVTFVPDQALAADSAAVVLLCAHQKQSLEVESIRVRKYPAGTDLTTFPKAKPVLRTYPGREPDAAWRTAALERIEQHRKNDLSLTLTDTEGAPIADAEVSLSLRRHEFGFGSAVVAKRFSGESEDDRRYREIIDRLFSIVVFENDLKDGQWSPDFGAAQKESRNRELEAAFAWLEERRISVRGHYLMQVATPYNLHNITDSEEIRRRTRASVAERLDFVRDRVIEWDVINHPIAWGGADMLNQRPGLEHLDREIFELAREKTGLPFFVNEDQVFRPGPQCDDTYTYIKGLNESGLTVAGLGNQAHFHESYLPSPEHLLAITDRFATLVPHQSITEYDIVTNEDEQLAADYTRDVLIAVFSHPAYTSFLLWGFWEGSHWKPEAASWNRDWSTRLRGDVLEEWIGQRWHTALTARTDAEGRIAFRGFPGWYEIRENGRTQLVRLGRDKPDEVLKR
jgi:endo-1,4-beta-xylanase